MKILVNYNPADKAYLSALAYILRDYGVTAVSSANGHTIGELLEKAKRAGCSAILLCNDETLRYCVPGSAPTLDKWRGSRLNFSVPTIVCNSLKHIHSVSHGEWLLRKDIEKFKWILKSPATFKFTVLDTVDKFAAAEKILSRSITIAHDIETRTIGEDESVDPPQGGTTLITCASWTGIMPDGTLKTFVIPFINYDGDHWNTDEQYGKALDFMRRMNALPIPKIMHNGMYDSTHLIRYHCEPLYYTLDTMALAHAQFCELPKDLAFVSSHTLYDYVFWKDDADDAAKKKDIAKYWQYNAKDTWHTARVFVEQLRLMPAYARRNFARKFKLVYPSLYCNFEGIKIDQTVRLRIRTEADVRLQESRSTLRTCFADPNFNPGSWQQVQKYIYRVFGAKHPKVGKSKSGTDEKNLVEVSKQHPILATLCGKILEYREAQKAIGTYFDFKQKEGRLLYALNPFGTETERMACSASSLWCGTQVQNVPSYAKEMLVADDGFLLFEIDNSQSEARCTAYCSQETTLIAALEDKGKDFYKTLGTLFFNIPYENVTKFFRNKVIKKVVHGTNYMMGAKTFIENITVKVLLETAVALGLKLVPIPAKGKKDEKTMTEFANDLLDTYHKPFPRVRMWYKEIYNEIKTTGQLVSPLGHVRVFFGRIDKEHDMLRGAVAHQPQNLSVEVLNIGLWRMYTEMVLTQKGQFRIKAQVHDSILGQFPADKRDFYMPWAMKCMDNPVEVHGRILRIPIDGKTGKAWIEQEIVENEDGTVTVMYPEGCVKYKLPD